MSLKNSQHRESLKHEYIFGTIHKDGRRSFQSLDSLIKQYDLAPATIYRSSAKEQWRKQRLAFKAELTEEIKLARKNDIVNDIQFIQNKATQGLSLILDKALHIWKQIMLSIQEGYLISHKPLLPAAEICQR